MKLFGSKLMKLYKKGRLYIPLRYMKTIINEKNFLSYDKYESCFKFGDQVLKICSKKVKYFKQFKDNNAQNLKQLVDTLNYILLPINAIIYEDGDVFAYTQPIYQMIISKHQQLDSKSFFELIQMERILLDHSVDLDLSIDRMCHYDNRIVVFSYYNLCPLVLDDRWRSDASKYVIRNIIWYYLRDTSSNYRRALKNTHLPNYCLKFYYQILNPQLLRLDLIVAYDNFLKYVGGV